MLQKSWYVSYTHTYTDTLHIWFPFLMTSPYLTTLRKKKTKDCFDPCLLCIPTQEAYSMARQFNLIPPVCEQAENHFFQREKMEMQLPELYHKIGVQTFVPPFLFHP